MVKQSFVIAVLVLSLSLPLAAFAADQIVTVTGRILVRAGVCAVRVTSAKNDADKPMEELKDAVLTITGPERDKLIQLPKQAVVLKGLLKENKTLFVTDIITYKPEK